MHTTHFWDLFDLCREKIRRAFQTLLLITQRNDLLISVLLLGLCPLIPSQAQTMQYFRKNLEYYDDKPIHFGYLMGLPLTRFHFVHGDDFLTQDTTSRITSPRTAGFRMGFVVNAYLNEHWDIRTTPTVALYDRVLEYEYAGGTKRKELREATWFEIPLLLKYKSQRRKNSRMYMIGGVTLGLETNVRRRLQQGSDRLNAKSVDLSIDYGFGFEQFLAYTKFSPEIRFSHGIVNLNQNTAGSSIRRLTSHTVSIYFMFE